MSDVWRELPPCESVEEFVIGEKVVAYRVIPEELFVEDIERDVLALVQSRGGVKEFVHFKACRKLVKREAREWWIEPPERPEHADAGKVTHYRLHVSEGKMDNYIHVREVLEEEE